MNGKLVGAMHKKGSFLNESTGEMVAYDNIELVILRDIPSGGKFDPVASVGLSPEKIAKFPFEKIHEVFNDNVHEVTDLVDFLGFDIEYYYDGSKKICKVLKNGK